MKPTKKQLEKAAKLCQTTWHKLEAHDPEEIKILKYFYGYYMMATRRETMTAEDERNLYRIYRENNKEQLLADYLAYKKAYQNLIDLEAAAGLTD